MSSRRTKDFDSVEDFGFDWSLPDEDEIVESDWFISYGLSDDEDDLVINDEPAASFTTNSTTVWLSKGVQTVGYEYGVVNRITTLAGRIWDQTLTIIMMEK